MSKRPRLLLVSFSPLHRPRSAAAFAAIGLVASALAVRPFAGQGGGQAPPRRPAPQTAKPGELGYENTPTIPGQKWRVHDATRPPPPVVTPGPALGAPPSDAIVLFDGKDLSKWAQRVEREARGRQWPLQEGYFETGAAGSMITRENFGDVQLHVEFATPAVVAGTSQGRGNSGVIFMGRYEVQVLDFYKNRTYADGMAGSIYGDWPPLVNAARQPGDWQTYDIIFEAPRFEGDKLINPAYFTVIWNGVLVHNRKAVSGPTSLNTQHIYRPHDPELPLTLQDHANPVRFRNVWVRKPTLSLIAVSRSALRRC